MSWEAGTGRKKGEGKEKELDDDEAREEEKKGA